MREDQRTGQPEVWAFLTIITFPIVLIASELLEVGGWWPFCFGLLATFSILVLEAIVRGSLWPFEERFLNHIGHPETPYRILVFLGATLLILESVLVVGAATDPRFDAPLLGLVIRKQCAARDLSVGSDAICRFLTETHVTPKTEIKAADLAEHAIHTYAAKNWLPEASFVTCASRRILRDPTEANVIRELDLVYCSDWKMGDDRILRPGQNRTNYVASLLTKNANGFYTVALWSEDAHEANWDTTLGPIAVSARDRVESLGILPDLTVALQAEALGKAQMMLNL